MIGLYLWIKTGPSSAQAQPKVSRVACRQRLTPHRVTKKLSKDKTIWAQLQIVILAPPRTNASLTTPMRLTHTV